jgi:hypothetical protein
MIYRVWKDAEIFVVFIITAIRGLSGDMFDVIREQCQVRISCFRFLEVQVHEGRIGNESVPTFTSTFESKK